jgi:hypothetical protein
MILIVPAIRKNSLASICLVQKIIRRANARHIKGKQWRKREEEGTALEGGGREKIPLLNFFFANKPCSQSI